jgi:hypothetical protein
MECHCVPLITEEFDSCLFVPEGRWGPITKRQRLTRTLGQREKRDEIRVEEREEG